MSESTSQSLSKPWLTDPALDIPILEGEEFWSQRMIDFSGVARVSTRTEFVKMIQSSGTIGKFRASSDQHQED